MLKSWTPIHIAGSGKCTQIPQPKHKMSANKQQILVNPLQKKTQLRESCWGCFQYASDPGNIRNFQGKHLKKFDPIFRICESFGKSCICEILIMPCNIFFNKGEIAENTRQNTSISLTDYLTPSKNRPFLLMNIRSPPKAITKPPRNPPENKQPPEYSRK